jgi:hypothetical protein
MYMSDLRYIHDPVISSLKMEGVYIYFFGKVSHHPGLSASLKPRFGSLLLPAFPKPKITVESEEIGECDGHALHKLSQWQFTAD